MNGRNEGDKPISKTHDLIMNAAFTEFTNNGFKAATTSAIANAAGVNEVTLFRHFGSKRDLFIAMMERYANVLADENGAIRNTTGNLREDLIRIGGLFLSGVVKSRKIMIMSISEATRDRQIAAIVKLQPKTQNTLLSKYFSEQIKKGALRQNINPNYAAQAFFALFFDYAVYIELTMTKTPSKRKLQSIVKQCVDLFIYGVEKKEN